MSDSIDRTGRPSAFTASSPPEPLGQPSSLRKGIPSALPSRQEQDKADDFESFLNQTSTTFVAKPRKDHQSDAADLIANNSVYLPPTAFPS